MELKFIFSIVALFIGLYVSFVKYSGALVGLGLTLVVVATYLALTSK